MVVCVPGIPRLKIQICKSEHAFSHAYKSSLISKLVAISFALLRSFIISEGVAAAVFLQSSLFVRLAWKYKQGIIIILIS